MPSCLALTTYLLVLLLGLLPHWSSNQPLLGNLPDELARSDLTMSHSLVELPEWSHLSLHSSLLASQPFPSLPLP